MNRDAGNRPGGASATAAAEGPAARVVPVVLCCSASERRRSLRRVIDADPTLSVVGEARLAREALALVRRLSPRLLVLDLDDDDGLHLVEHLMALLPLPVLGCSALPDVGRTVRGIAALAAGAVDVLTVPLQQSLPPGAAEELRSRARTAARARVITHPRGRLRSGRPDATVPSGLSLRPGPPAGVEVVVVGASTGGPRALALLLARLPADFGPSVVIVQHMVDGFLEGLAGWLDGLCALPVGVAVHGQRLQPGSVVIAPGGRNLVVEENLRVRIEVAPPTQFHLPGVDATMSSVAALTQVRSVGVLLTGMGRDGAAGLLAMRLAGARTLGQDEATSVVYGMPAAAFEAGAVSEQLSLGAIADRVAALRAPGAAAGRPAWG